MLNERQQLLREIARNHESDSPRLVYADWLEERGESARAEFIRNACEIQSRRRQKKAWKVLWSRNRQILNRNERRWAAPLKALKIKKYRFHRGMIEWVTINAAKALSEIEEVLREFPTIRGAKITELHSIGNSFVDQFLGIPALNQLFELDLEHSRLGGIEVEKIGQAKHFINVETLRLAGNPIHQRGWDSILLGQGFPNLKRLDISRCNLGQEFSLDDTIHCPRFQNLEAFRANELFCAESVSLQLGKQMRNSRENW